MRGAMQPFAATLVIALAACTPIVEHESPTTPVEPSPVPATVATTPAVEPTSSVAPGGASCLEVVDFDAELAAMEVAPADVAKARKVLQTERTDYSKSPEEQNIPELKQVLEDPMPALAALLTDYELGDSVGFTMFAIDRDRAAPLVFGSMPKSDRNVQFHSFTRFLRLTFAGEPICWHAVVADAARRTLDTGTNADAAEQAIYALGVAGNASDSALFRRYLASTEPVEHWRTKLGNAAEAALARQGDRAAIDAIRHELGAAVPKTIDLKRGRELVAALDGAGFSRQRSLAPLVCRHLATPTPHSSSHVLPDSPSRHAAMALGHILDGRAPDAAPDDIAAWTERCKSGAL